MWYRFDVLGHFRRNGKEQAIESIFVEADNPLEAGEKLVDAASKDSVIIDLDLPAPPRPLHRFTAFLLGLTKTNCDIVVEAQH